MSHLDLMVTMDSANMHFASLVAPHPIHLGRDIARDGFAPYQSPDSPRPNEYIQVDGLECRPCSVFGDKRAASAVSVPPPHPALRCRIPDNGALPSGQPLTQPFLRVWCCRTSGHHLPCRDARLVRP